MTNTRVQALLDFATNHRWLTEAREGGWAVAPNDREPVELHSKGFTIFAPTDNSARVVEHAGWKQISQKAYRAAIEAYQPDTTPVLTQTEEEDGTLVNEVSVETAFLIPENASADFYEGALLTTHSIANRVHETAVRATAVLDEGLAPGMPEQLDPYTAAQAWLSLSNLVRDPRTVLAALHAKGPENITEDMLAGGAVACGNLVRIWQTFADALFAVPPTSRAGVKDFLKDLGEHADVLHELADQAFGERLSFDDADFEGLLS